VEVKERRAIAQLEAAIQREVAVVVIRLSRLTATLDLEANGRHLLRTMRLIE
jgi:hypothetical protein